MPKRTPSPWKHPKHGTYYIRIEVPADLREAIGRRWIKKSLRTSLLKEAKPRFAEEWSRVSALFEAHRDSHQLTFKDADILASRFHLDELEKLNTVADWSVYVGMVQERDPETGEVYEDVYPLDDFTNDFSFALKHNSQRLMEELEGDSADKLLIASGYKINKGHPTYHYLLRQVCYSRLEVQRKAVQAYKGRWRPTKPDKLVVDLLSSERSPANRQQVSRAAMGPSGNTLSDLIESYIYHGLEQGQWADRTLSEVRLVLDGFKSYMGGERNPESITREDFREFRSNLARLPSRYSNSDKYKGLTLRQIADKAARDGAKTLSPATLYKKFTFVVSLFKFALLEELVTTNRAASLNKKVEQVDAKPVFSDPDIQKVFNHYSDRKSANYWIPRIALLGMRQGEICQLHRRDFKKFEDIHYIELGADKQLKNKNSRRKVPIPDFLLNSGVLEYVESRRGKLFDVNQAYYSKEFNKVMERLGLKPKNFHTFRHTFRARLRQADISAEAANLLGGWASETYSTGDHYGNDYLSFLERLHHAINSLSYDLE